jgi:hypothetical protein
VVAITFMTPYAYGGSNIKMGDDEIVAIMFVLTLSNCEIIIIIIIIIIIHLY